MTWGEDNWFNYTYNTEMFTLYRGIAEVANVSYIFSANKDTLSLSSSHGISGTYVKQ